MSQIIYLVLIFNGYFSTLGQKIAESAVMEMELFFGNDPCLMLSLCLGIP